MSKYLFSFLVLSLFLSKASGQSQSQEAAIRYQSWMSNSILDRYFEVDKLELPVTEDIKDILYIKEKLSKDSLKYLGSIWSIIRNQLKYENQNLGGILLSQFAVIIGKPIQEVEVIITGGSEFNVRIKFQNGQVTYQEDFELVRDTYLLLSTSPILYEPYECFHVVGKAEEVILEFKQEIKVYLEEISLDQNNNPDRVFINETSPYTWSVSLKDVKGVITDRYNEKIELEFSAFPKQEFVNVCYRLNARFSSGLNESGMFKDMEQYYFKELIAYNQKTKDTIFHFINQ